MKKLLLYLFSLIALVSCDMSAAKSPETFLMNQDEANKNPVIDALLKQSSQLWQTEPVQSIDFAKQALDAATTAKSDFYRATAWVYIGSGYFYLKNYDEAENSYHQAFDLFKQIKNDEGCVRVLKNLVILADIKGFQKDRVKYINQMSEIAEYSSSESVKLITNNAIGNLYYDIGDLPKAYEYHLSASQYNGDNTLMINSLNDLGNVYTDMGKYNEAIECYERIINTNISEFLPISRANALSNLGDVYSMMGNYPKAIQTLNQAIGLLKEFNDKQGLIYAYTYLGDALIESGDYAATEVAYNEAYNYSKICNDSTSIAFSEMKLSEVSLAKKDYKTALRYLEIPREYFRKEGINKQLLTVYELYSEIYSGMGKNTEALAYYKLFNDLTRKVADETLRHSLDVAQQKVEAEKEMQDARMEREIQKANYSQMRNLFISLLVFTAIIAFAGFKYRSLSKQLRARNRELAKLNEKQKIVYDTLVDDLKASLFQLTYQIAQLENQELYDSLTNSYREFSAKYNELLQDVNN